MTEIEKDPHIVYERRLSQSSHGPKINKKGFELGETSDRNFSAANQKNPTRFATPVV